MAIEIREEVDAQIKFVPNYIPSKDLNESLSVNPISEDSIMVDIEGIHSVITRNLNYYEPHCLEISVPRWTEPYERPLIMHHKEQDGVTIGRIKQCTYVDSCERTKGPGLVFTCNVGNKDGIEGIKNGTLVTTSIGVMVRDLRCSICGKNLAEEGECEHVKGQRYDGKLCFWIIKDMEPKELSYVIVPSDKYAHNVKIYKPDAKMLGVSESYNNEDEVNELSIKDLYYDEISKSLAMKEAKALEEDGEKPEDKQVPDQPKPEGDDPKDDKAAEDKKPEDDKPEGEDPKGKDEPKDDPDDGDAAKDEGKDDKAKKENEALKAEVAELKKEIAKLKKEVVDLQGERDKEKETREAVELKYLEVKKQQRIALAEKVNEMRTSLGLEGENIEILSKSTEEALNTKIEVLKEFMCSGPELAKALPKVNSKISIDESADNTIKQNNKDKKDSNNNIEMQMKEKYNNLLRR